MKTTLICLVLLTLSTMACAQICDLDAELTDATCTHVADACVGGPGMHGCQSTTFVAPCTATYHLIAWISCTGGQECKSCLAEAWVYTENGTLVGCDHNDCGPGADCVGAAVNIQLTQGQKYTLYTCKLDCDDSGMDCDDCSADCTAQGSVTD